MLQKNKVHYMDVLDGLRQLPDESADCVLIDPPYNIGKDFGNNKTKTNINNYLSWASEWIEESTRILRPSGTMFIYGFSEILAHISVELDLEHRWLVWHYTNKTVPSLNFWQ
jgi:site-specific DNA-methyltransferase (adenine-specific)